MTQLILRVWSVDPNGDFDFEVADYGGDGVVSFAVHQYGYDDKPRTRVALTPERARDLASALMQAAASVDNQCDLIF